MAIATDRIQIYRGDTWSKSINVLDADGNAYNLTGYIWTMTVKRGTTEIISATGDCDDDPTTGIQPILLTSEDTDVTVRNNYDYDIEIRNTDTPPIVYTVAKDKLDILQDVTT